MAHFPLPRTYSVSRSTTQKIAMSDEGDTIVARPLHSLTPCHLYLLQEQVSCPIAHRPCSIHVVQTEEVVVIS